MKLTVLMKQNKILKGLTIPLKYYNIKYYYDILNIVFIIIQLLILYSQQNYYKSPSHRGGRGSSFVHDIEVSINVQLTITL